MNYSQKFWNKIAEKYSQSPVRDEATYQMKLAETQARFSEDMHILEFGCGTGSTAICHAPYVRHIEAIDIAENMIEIGRSRAEDAQVSNISFHQGTLEQFNAGSASMDAVLALNVMHLLPDRKAALAEVSRILKPGGMFVTSTVCLGRSYLRFIRWIIPLGKRLSLLPDLYILKEEEWTRELINAGFSIETQWHHGSQNIAVFIIARKSV